jgi:hypothetical protein
MLILGHNQKHIVIPVSKLILIGMENTFPGNNIYQLKKSELLGNKGAVH